MYRGYKMHIACLLFSLLFCDSAPATEYLIYSEGFVPGNATYTVGDTKNLNNSAINWHVRAENGTDLSGSAADPSRTLYDANSPDGDSYRSFMGSGSSMDLVMMSDAPVIPASWRDIPLKFSFSHRDNDANGNSSLRFLVKTGGEWYVSPSIASFHSTVAGNWVIASVYVETVEWFLWDEASLSDGFSVSTISSPGSYLEPGDITDIGILIIDTDSTDTFRIDDFRISTDLFFSEGFVPANATYTVGDSKPLNNSAIGWQAWAENGSDYSSSTTDPVRAVYDTAAPDGDSYRTFIGSGSALDFVLVSDTPELIDEQRNAPVKLSVQHRDNDPSGNSSLRFVAKVNGIWYVSSAFCSYHSSVSTNWATTSVYIDSTDWYAWESSVSDGFSTAGISSAGGALPVGDIVAAGVLVLNGDTGDTFRIDNFSITVEQLFREGFLPSSALYTAGDSKSLDDRNIEWNVWAENGTDYSSSSSDPVRTVYDAAAPDGDDYRTFLGSGTSLDLVMVADAPDLLENLWGRDLMLSVQHRDNDPGANSKLRFLIQMDGSWYVSENINPYHSSVTTDWGMTSVDIAESKWFAWESDLSDGFSAANISAIPVYPEPTDITGVGVLLVIVDSGDTFRLDDFRITTSHSSDLRNLDEPFVVSPREPFFMTLISDDCFRPLQMDMWNEFYPEELQSRICIEIGTKVDLENKLTLATDANIPVMFRVRSVWPVEIYEPMDMAYIEDILARYPIVRGVVVSELMNARFTKEERDYVLDLLELCSQYDKMLMWTESAGGAAPFMQVAEDSQLRKAVSENADRVMLIDEGVDGTLQVVNLSMLMGLQQAGVTKHWGMNPQLFYWANSGYSNLNVQLPARAGSRESMPASVYSKLMMASAMMGGSAFAFTGEATSHYFDDNFEPTSVWWATLPFIEELMSGKVIPTRDEVVQNMHLAVKGRPEELVWVSSSKSHTGSRSVGMRGELDNTGWCQENWIPISPASNYTLSCWRRVDAIADGAGLYIEAAYYEREAGDWPFLSKQSFSIDTQTLGSWQYFSTTLTIPANATDLAISVDLTGDTDETGAYYVDDIVLTDGVTANLVLNGGFESMDATANEPIGWAVSFDKNTAENADFGLTGEFLSRAYSLHGIGDMFIETGRRGLVPIMPSVWMPSGVLASNLVSLSPWNESAVQSAINGVPDDGCEGMRLQYPGRLWLASSLENVSGVQVLYGDVGDYTVTASLTSESHLLAVEHNAGRTHLIVSGREGESSIISIEGPDPFVIADDRQTSQASAFGSGYKLVLDVDHESGAITHKLVITKNE